MNDKLMELVQAAGAVSDARKPRIEEKRPFGTSSAEFSQSLVALDDALNALDLESEDPDYSPKYQDEYQRLWHEAAAERDWLKGALATSEEKLKQTEEKLVFARMTPRQKLIEVWRRWRRSCKESS